MKTKRPEVRLNLGGGDTEIPGYRTIDRKRGSEVYPLDGIEDGTVDEIYASHVLEHFTHTMTRTVLQHWVDKLKPGGLIRLAVPDFTWICKHHLAGTPMHTQGYVMGGGTDDNDWHGAIFDDESLAELMIACGLSNVSRWRPEELPDWPVDTSSLPVSLNLQGSKPFGQSDKIEDVFAVLSAPRFGPTMHSRCAFLAMQHTGIPYSVGTGAYWQQVLTNQIEDGAEAFRQQGRDPKWVLTFDYDTIFEPRQVVELYRLANAMEGVDAVTCLQMKRSSEAALFTIMDSAGKPKTSMSADCLTQNLLRITTGHFGMTLLRMEALERLPKPWFQATPDPDGSWRDGKIDADVAFWKSWQEAGNSLYLAPRVRVGHLQEVITWPTLRMDENSMTLVPHHQGQGEFEERGMPAIMASGGAA